MENESSVLPISIQNSENSPQTVILFGEKTLQILSIFEEDQNSSLLVTKAARTLHNLSSGFLDSNEASEIIENLVNEDNTGILFSPINSLYPDKTLLASLREAIEKDLLSPKE